MKSKKITSLILALAIIVLLSAQAASSTAIEQKAKPLAGALVGLIEDWGGMLVGSKTLYIPDYGVVIYVDAMIGGDFGKGKKGNMLGKEILELLPTLGKKIPIPDGKWVSVYVKLSDISASTVGIYEWQKGTARVRFWLDGQLKADEKDYYK